MSVHSEQLGVTLNGNIITRHKVPRAHLHILAAMYGQISVMYLEDGSLDVSAPMNQVDHKSYAGLIHHQKVEAEKKARSWLDKLRGKPDDDGPKPTNPRGSGGKVIEQQNTFAVAA